MLSDPDCGLYLLPVLGFSPDGNLVTFWARGLDSPGRADIGIWAVPLLGGQARPYLEGVAEYDWSADGSRLAYHPPGPGDPLEVSDTGRRAEAQTICSAPEGLHGHFPLWSADRADGAAVPLPPLTLARGGRHLAFLPQRRALLVLRGEIRHKSLRLVDLDGGAARQVTEVGPDFDLRDFDVSPDGRELVLEQAREPLDVVLIERPAR